MIKRIAEKWGYLIWNAHSESVEDHAGVQTKVESAIREALEEVAKKIEAMEGPFVIMEGECVKKENAARMIREMTK